jgi:hypothetical protein
VAEIKANDLLYAYQTDFDVNGNLVLQHEVFAQILSFDAKGKPIVSVSSGSEYLTNSILGMRFVRIGSTSDATRQSGILIDSLSNSAPRILMYDGLDDPAKLFSSAITKTLIGNLNGHYGYSARTYGAAFGGYGSGISNITVDDTNGIRIRNYETVLGQWDASGNVTFGEVAASKSNIYISSGALKLRNNTTEIISLNANGTSYFKGMIELSGVGGVKITGAGAGSNGFVLDVNGIRGYSSTLGLVFDLPTNGTAPTFSSGKIKEVEFEIYTSGVIRTSATVGDGSANSAGLLMNNTGIYGCKANQLLANGNVRILNDGTFYFGGDANNNITWNGSSLAVKGSITLTNTISADSITDGTTNKVFTATNQTKLTGIAAGADVTLAAINGALTITGGGLVLSSGGAMIRSGQTAYNTGTGFWLGLDSTTPKFSIGVSSGNYLTWDGSVLTIKGSLTFTNTVSADILTDGTTNKAYTATEKTKLGTVASNADVTLAAINGALTITGGGLVLSSGGAMIRSGQTAYNTGTGFWLGLDSTTPKFSIGVSSGNYLTWDGTALNIGGSLITSSASGGYAKVYYLEYATGYSSGVWEMGFNSRAINRVYALVPTDPYIGGAYDYVIDQNFLQTNVSFTKEVQFKSSSATWMVEKIVMKTAANAGVLTSKLKYYYYTITYFNELQFGTAGADYDVNLYRAAADTLKTDDIFDAFRIKINGSVGTAGEVLRSNGTNGFVNATLGLTDLTATTASKIAVTDSNGKVAASSIASAELFTPEYGALKHTDNATTIVSDTSWEKYTGFVSAYTKGTTVASNAITVGTAGKYEISYSLTFTKTGATGSTIYFDAFIAGGNSSNEAGKRATKVRDVYNETISNTFIMNLSANDTIDLRMYSTDADTITVVYASLNVVKISN